MFSDPRTGALILERKAVPAGLDQYCDGVRMVNGAYVAMPNTLANLQALAALGLDVPAPLADYDWPRMPGFEPMHVQRITANWLVLRKRAYVLSEMRTGKTMASLWAADALMDRNPGMKALIVAPLSTLLRTWGAAIDEHFMGKRTYTILHGSATQREKELKKDVDFYIINHDGLGVGVQIGRRGIALRGFGAALGAHPDIRLAILDEIGAYRDAGSRRSRITRSFVHSLDYVWGMTGTPTPKAPTDAHGLARLIDPEYSESFSSLQARTMLRISQFQWRPQRGSHETVAKLLDPAICYTQEDCFDAPPETREMRDIGFTKEQKTFYAKLKRELQATTESGGSINVANEGALRTKLFQLSAGAIYDKDHASHGIDSEPRYRELIDVIEQAPKKTVVFVSLTNVLNLLNKKLTDDGYSCVSVSGAVTGRDRDNALNAFCKPNGPRILLGVYGTIARGLDLTAAATIVCYTPTDMPEDYMQALQRINGPKQTHCRHIVQFSSSNVEREVYRRLDASESLQGAVLKMIEER